MAKNDEGDFELILGNRQLLSVFFVVVILLGVFFTMGYIVGRNSAPMVVESSPQKADAKPVAIESTAAPGASAASSQAENTASADSPEQTASAVEQPAAEAPPEETAKPAKETAKSERTKNVSVKEATARASENEPVSGQSYLQLAATSKHEADIMVDVLRNKGFKSLAAEIAEKPGKYRVLVGPITDTTANKMRADLQGAGFPGNAAIRRTF